LEDDLANSSGYVLDPVFSLRTRVTIKPGERARFALITTAGQTREELVSIFEKYKEPNTAEAAESAFEMAWTQSQLELRHLRLQPDAVRRFQELANHVLYPNPRLRPTGGRLRQNSLNKTRLWAYGISGDLPIIALTVTDVKELDFVQEILTAHTYLRTKGLKADLVILNYESGSYFQPLQESLRRMAQAHAMLTGLDQPGQGAAGGGAWNLGATAGQSGRQYELATPPEGPKTV
jgi:cyclic beta-1,2-glucan synthetase